MAPLPTLTPECFTAHCQKAGFSLDQARLFFQELSALASPYQFEPQRLRRTPWLRSLAHWHRHFRNLIEQVRTVDDWLAYQKAWRHHVFDGPHAHGGHFSATGDARRFLFTHWPLLSMGEPEAAFENRCSGRWPAGEAGAPKSWAGLAARVNHPRLLGRLLAELPAVVRQSAPASVDAWARLLRQTGLRSVRVHWAESPHAQLAVLMDILQEAQSLLTAPLGWTGPVLGLAGATGLEFVAGAGDGSGQVRLDPFTTGQTLMVDDWGVMAHEWLHTLDATLARDTQQPTRWMTLGLAEDVHTLPTQWAIAQAGSAWWDQVNLIQFAPLPVAVLTQVDSDLADWPTRLRETLGVVPGFEARMIEESVRLQRGDWHEDESQRRWQEWIGLALPEADDDLAWRTAQLFSAEMALIGHTQSLDGPVWATFLRQRAHDRGLAGTAPRSTQQRYLASPIELMARSFEAAFGPHEGDPNPVWLVTRSAAGMVWPLPAEQSYQRDGWTRCLKAMEPWWQLRQATLSPLALQPVKNLSSRSKR